MGYIDWKNHTTKDIYRMWRALGDTVGIHTHFRHNNSTVKLTSILPPSTRMSYKNERTEEYSYGMLRYDSKQELLFVRCKDGWCCLSHLHVENHRVITAKEFALGYRFSNTREPSEEFMFEKMTSMSNEENK